MPGVHSKQTRLDQLDLKNSLQRSRKINFEGLHFKGPCQDSWEIQKYMCESVDPRLSKYYRSKQENGSPNPYWITSEEGLVLLKNELEFCLEFSVKVREYDRETRTSVKTWIQIITWYKREYLIKAMKSHKEIKLHLSEFLEDSHILKIMVDCRHQVLAIARDFGLRIFPIANIIEFGVAFKPSHPRSMYNFDSLCSRYASQIKVDIPDMTTFLEATTATFEQIYFATHEVHLPLRIFNIMQAKMNAGSIRVGFFRSYVLGRINYKYTPLIFDADAAMSISVTWFPFP